MNLGSRNFVLLAAQPEALRGLFETHGRLVEESQGFQHRPTKECLSTVELSHRVVTGCLASVPDPQGKLEMTHCAPDVFRGVRHVDSSQA